MSSLDVERAPQDLKLKFLKSINIDEVIPISARQIKRQKVLKLTSLHTTGFKRL